MDSTPVTASLWGYNLRRSLDGSFTARRRGLLATEFALLGPGDESFGLLRLHGLSAAKFESEGHVATFVGSEERYRMVVDDEDVLAAAPNERSLDELEIQCGGRTYEGRASFFRNLAVASSRENREVAARVSGGPTGRSYKAVFAAEDACALPLAVFLLWHLAANRRRAYRLGSLPRGGAM